MTFDNAKPSAIEPAGVSRPVRTRRWLGPSLAVLLLAAGGAYFAWPHLAPQPPAQAAAGAPPAVPVSVAVVEQHDTPVWNEFSGRLEAVNRVEIRPRVAGAIVEAHFREGSLVRQGDPLFTIDPAPYSAEVRRLEAQVAAAGARLVLAARDQQRGFTLLGNSDLAQSEVDKRVNEYRAAEANLRASQAALDVARLNLDWTEVRAPIAGRVGRIEVTAGNLVPGGSTAPVLTTLVSVNPIYASFEADEDSVAQALATLPATGSDISGEIGRIPVRMGTLGIDGTPFAGRVQLVDNVVDSRNGTVRVRAVFDNADGRLIPGQFARIRLGQARTVPALAITERAIGTDQDRRFVLVVGGDDKATYREIKLGPVVDGLRIVAAGLQPGERIVVNGLQRIRPGAVVSPKVVPMPAPNAAVASR